MSTDESASQTADPSERVLRLPPDPRASFVLHPETLTEDREAFIDLVASADRNLWIISPTFGPGAAGAFQPDELARMRADAPERRVLAWLPIGFDERDMADWPAAATNNGLLPRWVIGESRRGEDAWTVAWWHPAWQERVIQRMKAAIDAGFDGVVLGGVDAWHDFERLEELSTPGGLNPETGRTWRSDMQRLIRLTTKFSIVDTDGRFAVMTAGGAELLSDPEHRASIDGVIMEGLFLAPTKSLRVVEEYLVPFREAEGVVVVVEDPSRASAVSRATTSADEGGFALLLADPARANLGLAR